jgi:hypothetical protein
MGRLPDIETIFFRKSVEFFLKKKGRSPVKIDQRECVGRSPVKIDQGKCAWVVAPENKPK